MLLAAGAIEADQLTLLPQAKQLGLQMGHGPVGDEAISQAAAMVKRGQSPKTSWSTETNRPLHTGLRNEPYEKSKIPVPET